MEKLLFHSLEVIGFRAFKHLKVERVGRVNLIVGKNNVGKTCLLEALRLYAEGGIPKVLQELLEFRDELTPQTSHDLGALVKSIPFLFHRNSDKNIPPSIRIGSSRSPQDMFVLSPALMAS